jgi:hypothetical protein
MEMKLFRSQKRMGLAILSGGLAFVGNASATELLIDGSFENTVNSTLPVVKVGGQQNPDVGQGWSTFSTYLYSTQYTLPGPPSSGDGYLRPYASGVNGIARSSAHVQQRVNLTSGTTLTPAKIDAGQATFRMSAWFSSYLTQGDYSDLTLEFLTDADAVVGDPVPLGGFDFVEAIPTGENSKYTDAKEFAQDVRSGTIPVGARRARVSIQSTSISGSPDGYVDNVSLDVTDAALATPVITSALPGNNAVGVGPIVNLTVAIEDRNSAVNTNSIQLFLDNNLVNASVSKIETNTFVQFNAGVLPSLSQHSYRIIFADDSVTPVRQTNTFQFTVAQFLTLPSSLRRPLGTEDVNKPGFNVSVYQLAPVETDPAPIQATPPPSIGFAESMLAGYAGENIADLTLAVSSNRFEIPGVINWINSLGVPGNFPDDTAFPGIPGNTGDEQNFVHDITTYARFPQAGFYRMGVTSDDHFRVTAATSGVQTLRVTSPTNYVIPTVPLATNITQIQFGAPIPPAGISGQVVYATPSGDPEAACALLTPGNMNGKIALLDRGGTNCNSADKALQAQLAGAIAVIEITPGDSGYPFRIDDVNTSVTIPVLVISEGFGGAQLKQLLAQPAPVTVSLQADTNPRLSEWDAPKFFGAVDVLFGFAVPEAGIYPLRLVAGQEGGNASLEWYLVNGDGSKILLNDSTSPVKTFRAVAALMQFNPPTFANGKVTISWTGGGTLQETTNLGGTWGNSANQANPQSVTPGGQAKFFRLIQ